MVLYKTLSDRTYNLVLGGFVLYGLLINILTVLFCTPLFATMNPVLFWLLLVLPFIGIACGRSTRLGIRILAFHLIVVPFGPLMASILPAYAAEEVFLALVLTASITLCMIGISVFFPDFFLRLGGVLFLSLILVIIAEIVALILGFHSSAFSVIGVLLFSLYIGFDWYRAQHHSKTLFSAIDCAIDLYLDITNLFLDLLDLIDWSDLFD